MNLQLRQACRCDAAYSPKQSFNGVLIARTKTVLSHNLFR